jgi:hypothetical protein
MSKAVRAVLFTIALVVSAVAVLAGCGSSHSAASHFYNDPHATPTTLGSANLPVAPRNEPINSRIPTWPWE